MSFIQEIKSPQDMLLKLVREANRINFEKNETDLMDHFFNFSVTAHSMRDWCLKYQSISEREAKKEAHRNFDKEDFLVIAKDIANSVKHFGIDLYTPSLSGASPDSASFVEFRYGENIPEKMDKAVQDKDFRDSESQQALSYIIKFEDGKEVTLNSFVFNVVNFWVSYFDSNEIPKNEKCNSKLIYVNRPFWGQFT